MADSCPRGEGAKIDTLPPPRPHSHFSQSPGTNLGGSHTLTGCFPGCYFMMIKLTHSFEGWPVCLELILIFCCEFIAGHRCPMGVILKPSVDLQSSCALLHGFLCSHWSLQRHVLGVGSPTIKSQGDHWLQTS